MILEINLLNTSSFQSSIFRENSKFLAILFLDLQLIIKIDVLKLSFTANDTVFTRFSADYFLRLEKVFRSERNEFSTVYEQFLVYRIAQGC